MYIPQPSGAQSAARPVHRYGSESSVTLTLSHRGEVRVLYGEQRVDANLQPLFLYSLWDFPPPGQKQVSSYERKVQIQL